MIAPNAPLHMNRWARNERLYRHLLGLGLVVDPVFADAERTQIDHLIVSADLPSPEETAESAAKRGVGAVVERAEVGEIVASAERDGLNVIDFPPVLR